MFVEPASRRAGGARSMLGAPEKIALDLGYGMLRPEAGSLRTAVIRLLHPYAIGTYRVKL